MKKKLYILAVLFFGLFTPAVALPAPANAVDVFHCSQIPRGGTTDVCKEQASSKGNPFTHTIKVVLDILSAIVGVAAVIMVIFSALRMIWAQGDAQEVKRAREGIIGAAVGIAVTVLAQAIVVFVLDKIK